MPCWDHKNGRRISAGLFAVNPQVLLLRENVVAALGEGDVHGISGYGTGDILFLVIQQFSLGSHLSVTECVRIRASGCLSVGNTLQGFVCFCEGEGKGTQSQLFSSGLGGSIE